MKASMNAKKMMASTLTHDMRTPLNAMIGFISTVDIN